MPPPTTERSIAILGPGLLGGSMAKALHRSSPACPVRIWGRREDAVQEIRDQGLASFASTDAQAVVRGASLIVFAVPVRVMADLARQIAGAVAGDALITDAGSVKQCVVEALEPVFAPGVASFIGSHPMAGSHRTGLAAAREDLFDGATCLLTPTKQTQPGAVERVTEFWTSLGCDPARIFSLPLEMHDRKVARISHMPHAVAYALVRAALCDDREAVKCAGPGFRDATRIAGSDPDLWTGILMENRQAVLDSLEDVGTQLTELVEIIRNSNEVALRRFLSEARALQQLIPAETKTHGND
jgi:prephenate dehydrogenase